MSSSFWIDQLFASKRVEGSKRRSGIFHSHLLAQALGNPHKAYPCIHVAGSNGKGSVSLKIAKALELHGLRVGLYTSPHLIHFSERIRIDSIPIDLRSLEEGLQLLFSIEERLKIEATFFDLATQLAFHHFRAMQVDVAVIETGLGGKLDATNILDPVLSVITSISYEHAEYLGDTLEKIAEEKSGILKQNTPCVVGPYADLEPIRQRAQELKCIYHVAEKGSFFFDEENTQIARLALKVLSLAELKGELLIVCGSFYIMKEALSAYVCLSPA
ncbi:MAG: hypothetical protein HYZ48_00700 [Chlamydiales bacterium]|nr:hypothetical protein [Chlamydiales bacterium]